MGRALLALVPCGRDPQPACLVPGCRTAVVSSCPPPRQCPAACALRAPWDRCQARGGTAWCPFLPRPVPAS